MSNNIIVNYNPIGSSYKIRNQEKNNYFHRTIDNFFSSLHLTITQTDSYDSDFNVYIKDKSAGEIFNAYQKMILNSEWDCRDNGDYHTIILGREYMFYNVDGKIVSSTTENNVKNSDEITFKLTYQSPVSFFPFINKELIDNNIIHVYDEGTILKSKNESKINTESNLKKMINRDKCRKFSENHFAISGFNLIGHSISINSQVCNTMSEVMDDDEKNSISVLGDVEDKYIVEMTAVPEFPTSSINVDEEFEHKSDEFLANKLLEELRYCYQGSIIMKFNPDIEIGDTITLMDNVSSTYGVFQIDSYEHSLDQRGLITSLVVRASWTPKDPFLDYHSTSISYKLINELKHNFNLDESEDSINSEIHKIMSLYLKYVVQTPKYCVFYKKKKKGFFNPSTIAYKNITSPTALPLRFFPMMIKGKAQIPKSLEPAFIAGKENGIADILSAITSNLTTLFKDCLFGFIQTGKRILTFIADMLISTVTFNMSELLKPIFGMTEEKAREKTYDDVKYIDGDDALNMLQYNPYEKKYKLMYNNFDLVFGFFNVRFQKEDDLYAANKLLEKTPQNNQSFINRKVHTVRKLMTDVFDCLFLVELYDSFNSNIGSKNYNIDDFLNDCSSDNSKIICKEKIYTNDYGNEYGAILKNDNVNNISYKTIKLDEDNRYAIEVTVDVSSFKLNEYKYSEETESKNVAFDVKQKGNKYYLKKYLEEIKIVFFHNLYGDNKFDKGENSLETRRKNVRELLEKYDQYCNSKTTGVIIMADFNLNVYNKGELPYKENKNYNYELPNNNFIAKIKTATTLNQYGYLKGNQYDNVILSKNINGVITAKVFEYPEKDKLTISDHVPIYVGIKKTQE